MFYTEEMVKAHKLDKTCSICGEPAHAFIPLKGNRKALEICHKCAVTVLPGIVGETIISNEDFLSQVENTEHYLDTSKLVMDVNFWKHVACAMPKVLKTSVPPERPVKRRPGRPRKKTTKTEEPTKGGGSVVPFSKSQPDSQPTPLPQQPREVAEQKKSPQQGELNTGENVEETKISDSVTRRRSTKGKGVTE
jgi:hypothetical protein